MSMEWDEILSDNGIMMGEGEAAKAIALGISAKTALSGGTTSVDVSGMCSSLFERIGWGFCDAVDQVISVIAPRFIDGNSMAYSSDIGELISVAGFTTAVYGATNGEVRLRGGGMLFDSEWIEQRKGVLHLFVNAGTPVEDAVFTKTSLNSNTWTVTGSSVSGATVTLPHSLNAIGSTATPTSYFRGAATYSTNVTLDSSKRYYLYLDPVYQRADVVLNGSTASTLEIYGATSTNHTFTVERPGIPTVIDLTDIPFANGGNTLTVVTDNTATFCNIPFDGLLDCYNMLGGATLCEAGILCFDPVTYGTRRCHLTASTTQVSIKFAIKCNSNQSQAETANVYAYVYEGDDTTAMNQVTATEVEVNPGETKTYTMTVNLGTNITNKRWGIGNGKLFRVKLELMKGSPATAWDTIEEYCGYRTFSAAKHNSSDGGYGLTLNGSTTSLYGVGYHHWDRMPTTDEMDADWEIISALKPKMIRFAYFPALHYLLDKCDQAGIAVMLEIPWMHDFHKGDWDPSNMESYRNPLRLRYQHNTTANAVAMANEFYNHPSVLFYCIGTGFGIKNYHEYYPAQAYTFITEELLPALRAVDSSRLVCLEQATNDLSTWTSASDILIEHMNSGWGSGSIGDAVSEANTWNGKNDTLPFGFFDFSYGANPAHHVEWSSASTKPSDTGINNAVDYPEEYQAYCVEQYAGSALTLNWPVFQLYGTVFDYAAANVSHAGGKSGVMQTGLVTRDRSIFKDAYYYLKAMWNSEPMVYVTQKRNMDKTTSPVTLRIYTNCNYVKVYSSSMTLLDTIQRSSGSYVVTTSVELEEGNNLFYVTGHDTSSGEFTCSDSVLVNYEDTSGTAHILIYSDSAIVNSGTVNYAVTGATATPNPTVTWTSETPAIATINSGGTVTVLSDGTASIAAEAVVDGNTVSKVKNIPCYVRGATDSLYYQADSMADEISVTYRGITITNNKDGTSTLTGTLTNGTYDLAIWPTDTGRVHATRCLVPVWDIPGDLLITCDVLGGTITGTASGDPITLIPVDQNYNKLQQLELKPLNSKNGGGDTNAKLVTGSTLGIGGFYLKMGYTSGTVFDNVVIRVQTYKQADDYFDAGILEGRLEPVNTVILHSRDATPNHLTEHQNMYSRNADGSHSELIANPNNGTSVPGSARFTDGFAVGRNPSALITGSTIAVPGDVLRFTAVMKNWPPSYDISQLGNTTGEWSFTVIYADGTDAARLKWAYQGDATGVDFTGGTASKVFIAEKTVDYVGWDRTSFAFAGSLNGSNTITFQLRLEKLDPTQVPPNAIAAYASNRIVNTGYANAIGDPLSANQGVTWSSSNTSVATIDSSTGFITVVSDGQCTFTATSVLDSTKTGSVTVSCIKSTTTNMLGTMSTWSAAGTSVTTNGITITNNGDGTYTLNGTTSGTSEIGIKVVPTFSSANSFISYAPKSGIAGDVIVWMEHLSGTVSELSNYSGYDFGVRFYNESNSLMSDYNLNWIEKQTASGDGQNVLITGSTEGFRRATLLFKRPSGTVFDNYTFRLGLLKYSSLGVIYTGGLLSQSLPALYSMEFLGTKKVPISRNPDGSLFCMWGMANNPFTGDGYGYVKLTNGPAYYKNDSDIPVTDVVATSGKTYKFKVQLLESCPIGNNGGASALLEFVVLDVNRTAVAALRHVSENAVTTTFDNGAAETTFTATSNISCVCIRFSGGLRLNPGNLYFAVSLEEVTA